MNQEHVKIQTPEYVALQFKPAGLGSRASAFIIDQSIIMVTNILFFMVIFLAGRGVESFSSTNASPWILALIILVFFLINWGYFFVLEYFFGGRTVGKRWIGIRVIQDNGHSITLLSSLIRNLLRIIDSLPSAYFLGIIMIFFHSKHKRLGDLVAGTIVVYERKAHSGTTTSIIQEMEDRGLSKQDLTIDDWTLRSFGQEEWKLLKTYTERFLQLPYIERREVTKQLASLLFPKLGYEQGNKTNEEVENILLTLYLFLKEEWEYEL
ncbi:RDD family protein [Aquibacillus sediminis]|uniref:RDD family protein n=1 Tax=Aquibacillus sediminis TaxID=2574734 RepID=UPI001107C4AF|nr:RDD family protein [Aquibacillus sediminis]